MDTITILFEDGHDYTIPARGGHHFIDLVDGADCIELDVDDAVTEATYQYGTADAQIASAAAVHGLWPITREGDTLVLRLRDCCPLPPPGLRPLLKG